MDAYSTIQNIIFDLDGVLVDSRTLHYESLNQALREIDPKYVISLEEHLAKYDGCSTRIKLNRLTKEKGLPESLHSTVWSWKQDLTLALIKQQIVPDSKMISILESLSSKYHLYCASNSVWTTLETTLRQLNLLSYFRKIYSNGSVLPFTKPHPKIYLKCMEESALIPQQTLIVEDSPIGRLSAQLSGAHVCPVANAKSLSLPLIQSSISQAEASNKTIIYKTGWLSDVQIVIPMAGRGSRFANAGFHLPKPLIPIRGHPMISYVINNLRVDGATYFFIVQEEHLRNPAYHLQEIMDTYLPHKNYRLIPTSSITEGPACSVLLAKEYLNPEIPLLIANSDQFLEWDINAFLYQSEGVDGNISVFHPPTSNDTKWSYARLNAQGLVEEVKEKVVISDLATTGIYYWKRAGDLLRYTDQMIQANDRVNGEFYTCPVYNYAIRDHRTIKVSMCSTFWGLGVPADLQAFLDKYHPTQ